MKPYKSTSPEKTISWVRSILYEKAGILTREHHYNGDDEFYSCRVTIANNGVEEFDIGTNGKGTTVTYAMASAYGELMERIQNNILINRPNCIQNIRKFVYAPDEQTLVADENFISKYGKTFDCEIEKGKVFHTLPYCNVSKKSIEYLPAELVRAGCTSNGMCAGNTPLEAILQGLCEIVERYVLKLIYEQNVSFPTIPIDYFEHTSILSKIKEISSCNNWNIEIKDCSCGLIPAVGVLVLNETRTKYLFHIGAATSMQIALERALTEIYQGRNTVELIDIDVEYQTQLLFNDELKNKELNKTVINGTGQFPISIFEKKGISYIDEKQWNISDEDDFKLFLDVFAKMNAEIYIRDVSYLGFPAYSIFVPQMSQIKEIQLLQTLSNINIETCSKNNIKKIINEISTNNTTIKYRLKRYNNQDFWAKYNSDLIKSLLAYSINDFVTAIDSINKFISTQDIPATEITFWQCLRSIMICKKKELDLSYIQNIYGHDVLLSSVRFLENRSFLNYMSHKTGLTCEKCSIKNSCHESDVMNLTNALDNIYIRNTPDQNKLLKLITSKNRYDV